MKSKKRRDEEAKAEEMSKKPNPKYIQRYIRASNVKDYEAQGWEVIESKSKITARGDLVLMRKAS